MRSYVERGGLEHLFKSLFTLKKPPDGLKPTYMAECHLLGMDVMKLVASRHNVDSGFIQP